MKKTVFLKFASHFLPYALTLGVFALQRGKNAPDSDWVFIVAMAAVSLCLSLWAGSDAKKREQLEKEVKSLDGAVVKAGYEKVIAGFQGLDLADPQAPAIIKTLDGLWAVIKRRDK